jgi:hypothetical protein
MQTLTHKCRNEKMKKNFLINLLYILQLEILHFLGLRHQSRAATFQYPIQLISDYILSGLYGCRIN